jgi:hypothetical protein
MFDQKHMTVVPHTPYSPGHHFDTNEMTEAEWQAVLNTLTEHDFQDAYRIWHNRWERCIITERDYLELAQS